MSQTARLISLTTDFGLSETFVGQMKAVILTIAPEARIVDLTHDVPSHDIEAGAFALDIGCRPFPDDAIHVAVVDPGVGTQRPAVAVETRNGVFVGPDNGVLGRALRRREIIRAHELEDSRFRRHEIGSTFEGRDRFAPAAAWIAAGTPVARLGSPASALSIAGSPTIPRPGGPTVLVRVAHVDRFGNVMLDLDRTDLDPVEPLHPVVEVPGYPPITRYCRTYGEAPEGEPFLLFNSAGLLEIALRERPAARRLGLRTRESVRVGLRSAPRPEV